MKEIKTCSVIFLYVIVMGLLSTGFLHADHLDSLQVGPGVMYYSESRDYGPFQFDVLVIDMTNPYITFETVKANDRLYAFERTSSMSARKDRENHRIVGGVNGDFYNTSNGSPIGAQISNGEIVKTDEAWQTIGVSALNIPSVADVTFSGIAISDSGSAILNGVNSSRETDQMILFNSFYGASTGTNAYGSEARIVPLTDWYVNDTLRCVVEEIRTDQGNMPLTKGKAVLSGHGTFAGFINQLAADDTLLLVQNMLPGPEKLAQLVGGNTVLVRNGENAGGSGDRHPRTAAGYNADSTKFYLFTVDGRQPGYSIGMTYNELAAYMIEWGVYNGINLDGGGSSTMVVRGDVKNSPSDPGGERTVSNAFFVVSTAPDGDLYRLRIHPPLVYAIAGSEVQFNVQGLDEYYNNVSLSEENVVWSCDSTLGVIDENGRFVASDDTVSGYIYAHVGDIADSALVKKSILTTLTLTPDPVILNEGDFQQMDVEARDNYGNLITFALSDYEWRVEGGVGTISESGFFTATETGEGLIIAQYDTITGSAPVTVGISTSVLVDDFTSVSGFSLSGVNVNINECSFTADTSVYISGPSSGKLSYTLTTGGTSALYMNCNIPVSGHPDKVGIHVYGDGKGHWLRGEFQDNDGEKFLIDFTDASPGIDWENTWKLIEVNLDDAIPSWANPNAVLNYPIKWTRFYIAETSDDNKGSGILYFDDFIIDFITTEVNDDIQIPKSYKLEQNYPNPFNPETRIEYTLPKKSSVTLSVYDLNGQLIREWHYSNQDAGRYSIIWDGSNAMGKRVSTGLYLYSIRAGAYRNTKKMIVMK
jgi:hypothetical protein